MVQTESQYICIHQCLLTVLDGKENTSPVREIHHNQGYDGKFIVSFQFISNSIHQANRKLFCLE